MKNIAFIPARLESKRFPNKVIKSIFNLPMIEHVRRRAIISKVFERILIVTNSNLIKRKLNKYNAKTVITKKKHYNGTSRVSEVSHKFNFDYGFILFADEPLISINMLKKCEREIKKNKKILVYNVVTNIKKGDKKSQHIVKCLINEKGFITNYYRDAKKKNIKSTIRKSSGILIFKRSLLNKFYNLKRKYNEKTFKIEQFRFLENKIPIKSIFFRDIYPSINDKKEFRVLLKKVKKDKIELNNIKKIEKIEY